MVAALRLGFDDQGAPLIGNFRSQARTGDPAADDHDIEVHTAGYEFESPAV